MTYKDMTFCVQSLCKNTYARYLTEEIKEKAAKAKEPVSIGTFFCLDYGFKE